MAAKSLTFLRQVKKTGGFIKPFNSSMENKIKNNLFLINQEIKNTCKLYSQNAQRVNLIAVSKKIEKNRIIEAINLGCSDFGENYVQEAKEKWVEIKEKFPQIKLHLIGHLQSNKALEAVDLFDSIHSLDSKKLASELAKMTKKLNKNPEIFIQVNIGEEAQKDGVVLEELEDLIDFAKNKCNLNLVGLMCIPPLNEEASPYFALLSKLAKKYNLEKLSMGMSADFKAALALGATHIRIGSAIFK
jgi:pyridoxal phosphate enzyme (YggS family)